MIERDSEDQQIDLRSLNKEEPPPQELEERIVAALRERNLLHPLRKPFLTANLFAVIAACLVFFVAGMFYQKARGETPSAVSMSDSTFVLFLLEGASYQHARGEQEQQERIADYRNWAINLRKQGVPITGTKLREERELLGRVEVREGEEQISGYFLIDASNAKEALEIARKCPHLRYGGRIEVRRVHPV